MVPNARADFDNAFETFKKSWEAIEASILEVQNHVSASFVNSLVRHGKPMTGLLATLA